MCGICGFIGLEDKSLLERMCKVIQHRGPDESGTHIDKNIGLGHQRLSIIDLKTGKQPIHNEDESIWITYNGEVYNFPELKKALEKKGHRFYTETDTEVLVHAYEEHGTEFVKKLNGMFAFALWDSNQKKLLLARDKAGIKPLYYTLIDDGTFLFASEIKSILQYGEVKREVDLEGLNQIINLMYLPEEKTMFKGIKQLRPGHTLTYKAGKIDIVQYWDFMIKPAAGTEGYYTKKLRNALEDAVRRHMISDVPLGSFLSGGLDTSTIVGLMSKFSKEPVKTFCMGFGEENDELNDARRVAEHFGTEHYEFMIDPKYGLDILENAIWHAEIPKINLHPYCIYELTSKKVKVCMSGAGGDELLGGYLKKYKAAIWANRIKKSIPSLIRRNLFRRLRFIDKNRRYNYAWALSSLDNWSDFYLILYGDMLSEEELNSLYLKKPPQGLKKRYEPIFNNRLHPVDKVLLADVKTLLVDNYLVVDDTTSMANSLEIRVPFLDAEVIELSSQIPWNLKYKEGLGKYILRKAVADLLPKQVFTKKKRGFGFSSYYWLKDELLDRGGELTESKAINTYFKKKYVEKLLEDVKKAEHRKDHRKLELFMTILAFDTWHRIYIEGER